MPEKLGRSLRAFLEGVPRARAEGRAGAAARGVLQGMFGPLAERGGVPTAAKSGGAKLTEVGHHGEVVVYKMKGPAEMAMAATTATCC